MKETMGEVIVVVSRNQGIMLTIIYNAFEVGALIKEHQYLVGLHIKDQHFFSQC